MTTAQFTAQLPPARQPSSCHSDIPVTKIDTDRTDRQGLLTLQELVLRPSYGKPTNTVDFG